METKSPKSLEERLQAIEKRNQRVEMDKAWETSSTRKLLIAVLTYIIIVLFFAVAGISNPFLNAIVPTTGFVLSTLSIPIIKKAWIKRRK